MAQQIKPDIISNDQDRFEFYNENIPQRTLSLIPRRVSYISNLFPFANHYEDDQYISQSVGQHLSIGSSGISGRATTIIQPTIAQYIPILDQTGFITNKIRRSELSYPHKYKPSSDIKEQTRGHMYITRMGMNDYSENIPIHVNHICHQQPKGIKQRATSISQIKFTRHYLELDENPIQVKQLQRLAFPQYVTYKAPIDIQSSTGTIRKITSALGQDEPSEETSINFIQFRQPLMKDLSSFDRRTQQKVSSIFEPTVTTDLPILNETAIHLDKGHRSDLPQRIHYKSPVHIQPSISFMKKTTSTMSQEESPQETSININQLRQPISKHLSLTDEYQYVI